MCTPCFYLWPAARPQFADFFPADRARRPVGRAAFSALDGETARGKTHDRARAPRERRMRAVSCYNWLVAFVQGIAKPNLRVLSSFKA